MKIEIMLKTKKMKQMRNKYPDSSDLYSNTCRCFFLNKQKKIVALCMNEYEYEKPGRKLKWKILHQDEDVFFFFYAPCICFCLQHVHVAQPLLSDFTMTFRFSFIFPFFFLEFKPRLLKLRPDQGIYLIIAGKFRVKSS